MKGVWLYTSDDQKRSAVSRLCLRLGIPFNVISSRDAARSVGSVAGIPVPPAQETAVPPLWQMPEVMLLNGFQNAELDPLLRELRAQNLQIPLKACVTPYNCMWSLYTLCLNLKEEHDALRK